MRNTITGARVYRFHDAVAINFKVKDHSTWNETFYIPEALAHQIAALVQDGAEDITLKGFTSSELGTWNVVLDADGMVDLSKE